MRNFLKLYQFCTIERYHPNLIYTDEINSLFKLTRK